MDVSIVGSPTAGAVQFSPGGTPVAQTPTPTPAAPPAPVPVAATGSGASADPAASTSTKSPEPTLAQVKQPVDNINASLSANGNSDAVQFAVDPTSKRIVVQVLDPQTGKVIRQVPSEEIIQMGMALGQKLGQVIYQQA